MPNTPQDHKSKIEPFTFQGGDGKTHTLPSADKGRAKLTGRDLRDATMNGDLGQMAYMFKTLEACGAKQDALDALYAMPQDKMTDVLAAWGEHGDGDGASLGE